MGWGRRGALAMYLGLDIGTSSVKAVLIDARQRIVASKTAPLEVERPHPGWSEQDPDSWWRACETVLDQLAAERRQELAAVKGIGLSGHMHGATLLDAADKPLRPCILWNDVRSAVEAAELDGDARFRAITGNIVFPGFTAPKLVWVARHEPAIFAKVAKVLLPKDYVRLKLTGDYASDMSDSSGTSWLDVARRDWSDALLAATGLSRAQMPELFEGSAKTGVLRRELARAVGDRWAAGGRRRGRRQRRVGLRCRRGQAGQRLCLARHLGRALRLERPLLARSRDGRPCLLSRGAGHLAPDGRHPLGSGRA